MKQDKELIEKVKFAMRSYKRGSNISFRADEIISLCQPQWISVEDRLPENDECVDVFFTSNDCDARLTDYFYKKDTNQWWQWQSNYGGSTFKSVLPLGVTHWSKQLDPPEESK